ncbi:SprT-like domain-containing protein [Sphingobacterium sp. InxBP1]|uniref:SprT-like domain-containing protein n=1 Tax=Sphingobacterium sp. InxBP1 TaxID=2870328 RepID=UPI002243411D|nr:SprT-like domain-containing protein [Sphingobacterium sp. InxBP1]MCW8309986.1 SprT-like domain-containing protein [Sphingobacterium sp. InxBP1]
MQDYSATLKKYMPEEAAPIISNWINDTGCLFKISRSRSSKLGDYRAPFRGSPHRISVNHDLNRYSFLITTIHEFAHLQTWNKHQHRVKPHGTEWKNHFKQLMDPFLKLSIFPADIKQAILNYMENPAASSCTDLHLFRTLKAYDTAKSSALTVESLEDGHYFALKNGRSFQRIGKIRKRYKCMELSTRRIYLFNPIAEVFPLER